MSRGFRTGSIIPLGDGLTGKSVLTQLLLLEDRSDDNIQEIHNNIKKSLNIEMEFKATIRENDEGETIKSSIQFYVFPGQRQRYRDIAPSFDEILQIFNFLPAFESVNVLLLVHDTTRLESLKSLESWLMVSLQEGWITKETSICLITNKIDLKEPDGKFLADVSEGIKKMVKEMVPEFDVAAFKSFNTNCITGEGVDELEEWIEYWITHHGKKLSK